MKNNINNKSASNRYYEIKALCKLITLILLQLPRKHMCEVTGMNYFDKKVHKAYLRFTIMKCGGRKQVFFSSYMVYE
jgi:hypothetical protein